MQDSRTCQIEEVRVLVIFIKYPCCTVFDFRSCHHSNGMLGELIGKLGPTLGVFESGYPWSHYSNISRYF